MGMDIQVCLQLRTLVHDVRPEAVAARKMNAVKERATKALHVAIFDDGAIPLSTSLVLCKVHPKEHARSGASTRYLLLNAESDW